jgi:hypothetical protein
MDARKHGDLAEQHLLRIDPERPHVDREEAERALGAYLEALGLERAPVRWLPNIRALRRERVWPTARRGRWDALAMRQKGLFARGWSPGWRAGGGDWSRLVLPLTRVNALADADDIALVGGLGVSRGVHAVYRVVPQLEQSIGLMRDLSTFRPRQARALPPLAEAAAAGLFCYSVGPAGELVCLERPTMRLDERRRLHDWDGNPAVRWPDSTGLWFWRGVLMTEGAGRRPDRITGRRILSWANVERRRVAVERMGLEAFLRSVEADAVQQDDYGRLWRTAASIDGEPYVAVEVVNSTAEPDGSYRRYFLRVPPQIRSARAAVAWTFGIDTRDYRPVATT